MNTNISFWKKIKLFLFYTKTLNKIKRELLNNYKTKVDDVYRLYTILNLNNNSLFDENGSLEQRLANENYNLMPSQYEQRFIEEAYNRKLREFSTELSTFLNSKGLSELYVFYEIEKLNKFNYLVILGFSLFKTDQIIPKLIKTTRTVLGVILAICFVVFLAKYTDNLF
jgi:hypothetical protein